MTYFIFGEVFKQCDCPKIELLGTAKTKEEFSEKTASLLNKQSLAPKNLFVIIGEKHKIGIEIKPDSVMLES